MFWNLSYIFKNFNNNFPKKNVVFFWIKKKKNSHIFKILKNVQWAKFLNTDQLIAQIFCHTLNLLKTPQSKLKCQQTNQNKNKLKPYLFIFFLITEIQKLSLGTDGALLFVQQHPTRWTLKLNWRRLLCYTEMCSR